MGLKFFSFFFSCVFPLFTKLNHGMSGLHEGMMRGGYRVNTEMNVDVFSWMFSYVLSLGLIFSVASKVMMRGAWGHTGFGKWWF